MADDDINWAFKVTLTTPIQIKAKDNGEILDTISELAFRDPTALDIIEVGTNPVLIDMNANDPMSTTKFDAKAMSAMMARLCARPLMVIGKMSTGDWNYVAWQLSGNFLPVRATTS